MERLIIVSDRNVVELGTVGNNLEFFIDKVEVEKLIDYSIEVEDGLSEKEHLKIIERCIQEWNMSDNEEVTDL